jgi:two-component system chemotaxis response regulator CheB
MDDVLLKSPQLLKSPKLIAIGSSTGGVEAVMSIFANLPPNLPPIVIAQHIPYGFSKSFADRLNGIGEIFVKEASDGDVLQSGCAYVAQGNKHLIIEQNYKKEYVAKLDDGVKVNRHKPSVDVLFRSVNNSVGKSAMAIILTGMGDDGALGMKELFDNGAYTIAQDEASSIVFGMPKRAIETGGVCEILPLGEIYKNIIRF